MSHALGRDVPLPAVTGNFNPGDVRHCISSIERAKAELGFEPSTRLDDGIANLAQLFAENEKQMSGGGAKATKH